MTAWTAIGLTCGGVALFGASSTSRRGGRLGRLGAALMALIGLLVIFEYLVTPIGMDQLLFRASSRTDPGRPSPQTALCLLFLGLALGTVRLSTAWRRLHSLLLAGTAAIVLFVTVGYLFGVVALRGVSESDGVALHTLVGLILLTVGMTALLPDSEIVGLVRGRGSGALVARVLVSLGVAPVIIGATLFYLLRADVVGPRVALTLFTVTMIVLLALLALPLIIKVRNAEAGKGELSSQLQALFDNAPAVLSMRGPDGRYLHINRHGAEILGVAAEELIGQLPELPDGDSGLAVDDQEIVRSGHSVSHDERIERADGSVRDYHLVRYPVIENGQIRAFGTFGVDITERKRLMSELSLAQTRFRSAFDEAPIGMMVQGLEGEIQEVNPALCALVGRAAEELLRTGTASFIPVEDRMAKATARAELIRGPARSQTLALHYETVEGLPHPRRRSSHAGTHL
jgi:PAS domain S-box-containing protein